MMISNSRIGAPLLLSLTAALAFAGCDRERTVASPEAPPAAATSSASAAAAPAVAPAGVAIPAADLDLKYTVAGGPAYDVSAGTVTYTVRVQNNGKATLSSEGSAPINLGVVIRDEKHTLNSPPAKLDFVRIPFPSPLVSGASTVVTVRFPVAPTVGGIVVLDAVQEGVSWFSGYGKPVLELGRFNACAKDAKAICAADGTPLVTQGSP